MLVIVVQTLAVFIIIELRSPKNDLHFHIFRKSRDFDSIEFTPIFFRGCVLNQIERFFGEIGGQTTLDIIKFSVNQRRVVFRVPDEYFERTRAAISLIGHYQDVPCHFRVLETSKTPLDFVKEGEGIDCEEN